jgi:hypothetical protein
MDWRAAHRHGDTTGTTLGHSLASLAHTAGPPGARRLALTGPRLGAFIFDVGTLEETPGSGQDRHPLPHPSTQLRQAASCVVVVAVVYLLQYVRLQQVPDKCQRPSSDRQRCPARRVNVTGCVSAAFQPADDAPILLCACRGPAQTPPESLALSSQPAGRLSAGVLPGPARPCPALPGAVRPPAPHSLVCNCIRPAISYICSLGRLPRIPSRCFHPWLHAL